MLNSWLRACVSELLSFAHGIKIIRMPANLLREHKTAEGEVLFWGHSLSPQKNLKFPAYNVLGLEGVDIWLYYHIFWMRERLWVNYPIHKFLTNPPVFIYVSHLALWFLLILSLCRTLRGKLTPSSIFSFMNIKVISFFVLLHELLCSYLLFVFQNC